MNTFYNRLAAAMGMLALAALSAGCGAPPRAEGPYTRIDLVSDTASIPAAHIDPDLVNSWGIAFNPFGFAWVADNGTGVSTLYNGLGEKQALVVRIPGVAPNVGNPTGIVFYGGPAFTVTRGGVTGPSRFIFASEDGGISAWAPMVDATNAIRVYSSPRGAIYKGLAIGAGGDGTQPYIYATDFHNGRVDVFDSDFNEIVLHGNPFHDPNLPAGYAPFGIQAINGDIYVSYAKQDADAEDDEPGAGHGFVNIFSPDGDFVRRLITRGELNSPWGMAFAPASFGPLGNRLLVGNFGDGRINAYDIDSGRFVGRLRDEDGKAIVIDGLWGLAFGNGLQYQPTNTLFFASGPDGEAHGLYGRIERPGYNMVAKKK